MMDLHRHDEYSTFDGFGKATELVEIAKNLGYTSLGIANHGNTNGLIQHYLACKAGNIKPIMGVELYFKPKLNGKRGSYHLCLFAKNAIGYKNLNTIMYESEKQKYYTPLTTPNILKQYKEGIICTTACSGSFFGEAIQKDKIDVAEKSLKWFQNVFQDDFYVEIMPYKISDAGVQEKINETLMQMAKKLKIKCIMTSDSHYGKRADWPTYLKMHEIKGTTYDIGKSYGERYMPTKEDLIVRFETMHKNRKFAEEMLENMQELEDKIEPDILGGLKQLLPTLSGDSMRTIKDKCKQRLTELNKYNKEYVERAKEELNVIETLGFADYFLIVADYVQWAKDNGITVGPGRGSVCNCLVAYLLGITNVDSVLFGLDFRRFLRLDKKKLPDIDLDFEKSKRQNVVHYITERYPNQTARIASYGLYKVDNLINDLSKICGLSTLKDNPDREDAKIMIEEIKEHINQYIDENGNLDVAGFKKDKKTAMYNKNYDNILYHFTKMYKKVRFIGTHAAGVAVTGGNILEYTSLRLDKSGDIYTNYDLNDLENINVVKFDILGLMTMEMLGELRKLTGKVFDESWVKDKKVLDKFNKGETNGVFQFDRKAVQEMLRKIDANCFDDIAACNAMNRPGPMSMKMPETYAENKKKGANKNNPIYPYTKETYGTLVYQEQIQQICVNIGGMTWGEADKVMKMLGGQSQSADAQEKFQKDKAALGTIFVNGATKNGFTQHDAEEMFEKMLVYSFNKGHSVGYSLISVEEMYYKVYFPLEFWAVKIKNEPVEDKIWMHKKQAIQDGCCIIQPHVNGKSRTSIVKYNKDKVIQMGLSTIKGMGPKAADVIEKYGPYIDMPDFEEKMSELPKEEKRAITSRVTTLLKSNDCFEFNEDKWFKKQLYYNRGLLNK